MLPPRQEAITKTKLLVGAEEQKSATFKHKCLFHSTPRQDTRIDLSTKLVVTASDTAITKTTLLVGAKEQNR